METAAPRQNSKVLGLATKTRPALWAQVSFERPGKVALTFGGEALVAPVTPELA
jgi:hypothetical protein